ncbi:nuclear factor Y [Striga asiatica]|uniref:Nuclear transcription factor Y subunit n=1 Tax=Striga asiatica TaxID=4170 RepID=A0A5A7QXP5_STRAF|nr:nuclear factor Y [Striga asiatica]
MEDDGAGPTSKIPDEQPLTGSIPDGGAFPTANPFYDAYSASTRRRRSSSRTISTFRPTTTPWSSRWGIFRRPSRGKVGISEQTLLGKEGQANPELLDFEALIEGFDLATPLDLKRISIVIDNLCFINFFRSGLDEDRDLSLIFHMLWFEPEFENLSFQSRSKRCRRLEEFFSRSSSSAIVGFLETCKKKADLPNSGTDYLGHQVQMEHHNESLDSASYPFGESYFRKITTVYNPNPVVYPQVMEIASARAVLPLECTENMVPIYVNAKQYHAIVRRRKIRARLEAQNKITKSRKPYLHESRHLHALKRARGSGGCFLNTKSEEKSKPPGQEFCKKSENNSSWGASTPSASSDVSCIFNNSNDIFPPPDLEISIDSAERYMQIGTRA